MKRALVSTLILGLAFAAPGIASAQRPYPPPPAQRPYPPIPAPRYERIPPPPLGHVVWEPGHWRWTGAQYVWVGGQYVQRGPHQGHYVPGHWQFSPRTGQYVWRPAHWG
jgi:hypothetical protein